MDLDAIRLEMCQPAFIMHEGRVFGILNQLMDELDTLYKERQGWQDLFTTNSKKMLDENERLKDENARLARIADNLINERERV